MLSVILLLPAPTALGNPDSFGVGPFGPAGLFFDIFVIGDYYSGGNITIGVAFVNTEPNSYNNISITTAKLTTPWNVYVAKGLPIVMGQRQYCFIMFDVTIPPTQPTGDLKVILEATWSYWNGYVWGAGDPLQEEVSIKVFPNPYTMQKELDSTKSELTSLNSIIVLQNSTIKSLQDRASSLQSDISSLQSNVKSLQSDVKSRDDKIRSLESNATSLQSTLASKEDSIKSLQSTVISKENTISSLNTKINDINSEISSLKQQSASQTNIIYALVGIVVVLAIVSIFLSTRKKRVSQP